MPHIAMKTFLVATDFSRISTRQECCHALTEFVSTYHVDMLAMIPHRHSLFDNLLHSSVTKGIILKAKVPLLILPDIKPKH